MRSNAILVLLVAVGSSICWWPLQLEPSLDLRWWVPLLIVGLCCCLATMLSEGRVLLFSATSSISTLAAMVFADATWPVQDGIARSYAGIVIALATGAVVVVSLLAGLVGRCMPDLSQRVRWAIWIAFAGCVTFGPLVLAMRPQLIAHRMARNDRLAAERFMSLKLAVSRTMQEPGNPHSICEGPALKRNYSGPPFTDQDWRYIVGNYVQEDGYVFGMYVDCSRPAHYAIDVGPKRPNSDGTRTFCADESGAVGCVLSWNRSKYECSPCQK